METPAVDSFRPAPAPPPPQPPPPMAPQRGNAKIIILILGILLVIIGATGIAYVAGANNAARQSPSVMDVPTGETKNMNPSVPAVATDTPSQPQITVQPTEDLGLIKRAPDSLNPQETTDVTYYQVGKIQEGTYKGYQRFVAVIQPLNPAGALTEIFATRDNVKYILHGNPADATKYQADDWNNPYYLVNKEKITALADLGDHPETIEVPGNFVLYRNGVYTERRSTGSNSQESKAVLPTVFSQYSSLPSTSSTFRYYAKPLEPNPLVNESSARQKHDEEIKAKYLAATTEILVVDPQGLAYSYTLTTSANIARYQQQKAAFEKNSAAPYPMLPNVGFAKSDITPAQSTYDTYNQAFPYGCGLGVNTFVLKNVSDAEFNGIGTQQGIPLFTLTSKTHDLYTLAYDYKILNFSDVQSFEQMNKKSQPSFSDYLAKTPLLFVKDPWGRWVAVGEYDYQLMGGCGKPVVYLYPTKPTNVTVQFINPVQLSTDIPRYHHGWKVLANPDGILTDLQPEYTDCNGFTKVKAGSEYAQTACLNNRYPYLYWAGQSWGASYQTPRNGWIVANDQLGAFLEHKLAEIGFTSQESKDFRDYWVPKMSSSAAPYYRISFLQTEEMNMLIPLRISPTPETVFRLFLDWKPLASKPVKDLQPQTLAPISRVGFTVVEWGGASDR